MAEIEIREALPGEYEDTGGLIEACVEVARQSRITLRQDQWEAW